MSGGGAEHPMRRALVVDDGQTIRDLLATLLRRAGWEVLTTGDGASVRRMLRSGPVDAVLLDVHLGAERGPELLEELEGIRPGTAARSVFITGTPPATGRLRGRPVLGKPLTWADLRSQLEQLASDP